MPDGRAPRVARERHVQRGRPDGRLRRRACARARKSEDDANAGLGIERDVLEPVQARVPGALVRRHLDARGCVAIEESGGPKIDAPSLGRTDAATSAHRVPRVVGRLPDAAQGAQHLRDVFYRMGFDDRDIVALSGAHTLGRCHKTRSGFDGPWTHDPLKWDNSYFKNLTKFEWKPREWEGRCSTPTRRTNS